MARRRRLPVLAIALAIALAAGCTNRVGGRAAGPPPAPSTTTPAPTTTTTTTVPVAADIADLIAGTTMTDRARQVFLAAQPAVEDPATFATSCMLALAPDVPGQPKVRTQGCFVNGRIHLLAPDRPEAHDLLYVVAAHELLHAVYADLGPADRAQVDALVEAARAGNDRLEERLKPYGASPGLDNEMHSILGSEFDGLSPALEAHYALYFSNRSVLVADRQRTLGTREDQMGQLKADIADLDSRINALKDGQQSLRTAGDVRGYNANVPVINGLIDQYNAKVEALNALIDEYNSLLGA